MEELSQIDKKILYELSKDSRQSYKQIAQKINSKKDTVAYHIIQLQDKNIISKYIPIFNLSKLGISSSKMYINLHGLSKKDENEMLDSLTKNEDISWAAKTIGTWDLMIGFYTTNILDFSEKKNKILSEWGEFIENYNITQIENALTLDRNYLFNKKTEDRKEFLFAGKGKKIEIDKIDKKIIDLIKNNGKFEYLKLAEELKLDTRTIQSKIKNLTRKELIQGYTTFINTRTLGIQLHKLCISLRCYEQSKLNLLTDFLKKNPSTIHIIKSLGEWEMEVEIEEGDINKIYEYISKLKNQFPELIKKINLVTITEELKLDFFPENFEITST